MIGVDGEYTLGPLEPDFDHTLIGPFMSDGVRTFKGEELVERARLAIGPPAVNRPLDLHLEGSSPR